MKCPVCKDANLVMSERQGIEIDYCPDCRGVWLDRGELDKIIERSAPKEAAVQPQAQQQYAQQPPQYAQQPSHGHGYHHGKKPYRKKSFLEELFD